RWCIRCASAPAYAPEPRCRVQHASVRFVRRRCARRLSVHRASPPASQAVRGATGSAECKHCARSVLCGSQLERKSSDSARTARSARGIPEFNDALTVRSEHRKLTETPRRLGVTQELEGGCRVHALREGEPVTHAALRAWSVVGRHSGARNVSLRTLE